MDTSELRFPKGRPKKLEKADRRKARESADTTENIKVKDRSGGRCEMTELRTRKHTAVYVAMTGKSPGPVYRCERRALHIHHRLGGIGVRGRGASAKADNKLHLCKNCHEDVHAHVLIPNGPHFRRAK